jgi:site-specific recombinase XerD
MTHLRKMMLDELQRRNYAHTTAEAYVRALRNFAAFYRVPPDRLGPKQIREYQLYLLQKRKLSPKTVRQHMAAMKFFFEHTLKRYFRWEQIPYPKITERLPVVLSLEEVRQLIDATSNLFHRTILMTLYSTGMRRAELIHLKVEDIDSKRMVIRIREGKGAKDRDVPLSSTLLETLREYWIWKRPQTYLFPSNHQIRKGLYISGKGVFEICRTCAQRAGIKKKIGPHTLRHSFGTHLVDAGADLCTIQLLLGHARLEHTFIYLRLSQRHLHACSNPLDGLAVRDLTRVGRTRRYRKS